LCLQIVEEDGDGKGKATAAAAADISVSIYGPITKTCSCSYMLRWIRK